MVAGLIDFAAKTPFQLPGLGGATRQLLAAGVSTEDLWGELQVLGDISAGAQKPMNEMAAIYAKVMSKGKADTEALNQLSEAGVPIVQSLVDLAADYGNEITKEDVYKAAERGEISFRTLREALEKLTSEGGVFNDQMEKQSQTLFGLASTLKDNLFLGLASVGEKLVEITGLKDRLREFTERIQQAVEWFDKFAEERPGLVKLVFGLTAAAAVLGPALIALGLVVGGLGTGLTALGAALGILFSPVVLLGAAFAAAAWLIHEQLGRDRGFLRGRMGRDQGRVPRHGGLLRGALGQGGAARGRHLRLGDGRLGRGGGVDLRASRRRKLECLAHGPGRRPVLVGHGRLGQGHRRGPDAARRHMGRHQVRRVGGSGRRIGVLPGRLVGVPGAGLEPSSATALARWSWRASPG